MCSIVLRISPEGVLIGANRDEMLAREWDSPAAYWPELPGVIAGQDRIAGGTWLGINNRGMVAAVLNRRGTLGPAAGKRSRGELPLMALAEPDLAAAEAKILALDAGAYRSFNLVLADATGARFYRGLGSGAPTLQILDAGCWMITAGEANDLTSLRIARHLPKFRDAPAPAWQSLLADNTQPADSAINITPRNGFGTVCSSLTTLSPTAGPSWLFAAGPPHATEFKPVHLI